MEELVSEHGGDAVHQRLGAPAPIVNLLTGFRLEARFALGCYAIGNTRRFSEGLTESPLDSRAPTYSPVEDSIGIAKDARPCTRTASKNCGKSRHFQVSGAISPPRGMIAHKGATVQWTVRGDGTSSIKRVRCDAAGMKWLEARSHRCARRLRSRCTATQPTRRTRGAAPWPARIPAGE